jgi:hypothetical protein
MSVPRSEAMKRTGWSQLVLIWAALCVLVCSGCSDGEVKSNTSIDPDRELPSGQTPRVGKEFLLVPAGGLNLSAGVARTTSLRVFLYSRETGEGVKEQSIQYEIEGQQGTESSLASRNGTTNELGEARVDLRAGPSVGTVRVKVSHPAADPITFNVVVTPLETGSIEVRSVNTAPTIMPLRDVFVRLYDSNDFSCSDFYPLMRQPDPQAFYEVPQVSDVVLFEDLLAANTRYTVTAMAKGPRGQLAAGGCAEDIRVAPREITRTEIALQLIPINPVGRYDVTAVWDFTNALEDSGPVGSTIVRVLNVFNNPGRALYTEAINLLRSFIGLGADVLNSFLSLTGLDSRFENMINDAIAGNSILSRLQRAGQDLYEVIAKLKIHSQLTIGKLSSSYEFNGMDNWLGLTVYWRWNCAGNPDPECGAIPLVIDGMSQGADLGILSAQWTGRVVAFDQMQIDQHALTLRYGRLIIYILNEVILPQLTNGNARSLSQAFAYWIGCDSLAQSVLGQNERCALGFCVRADQVAAVCTSAVSTVFGFADLLVRNLEFDVGLSVGGSGKLVEEDSDGFVDRIVEGRFQGFMTRANGNMGQMVAAPISATWEGVRVSNQTGGL